jgi:hypothetical protein
MNESYFVQWVNKDGLKQVPVLVNGCQSFEAAARWALANDMPAWADDNTQFFVYYGNPQETANYARFTVGRVVPDLVAIDGDAPAGLVGLMWPPPLPPDFDDPAGEG